MSPIDLRAEIALSAKTVEEAMAALLGDPGRLAQRRLIEAMRYAALGGGKRLRPFLVRCTAKLGAASPSAVTRVGAAIEFVHCYSLIHDDLPAMDDSELRRGRPTCHRVFDEATAILAGDALLTFAFEILAADDLDLPARTRLELVRGLARAAGFEGMCGGQQLDLEAESEPDQSLDAIRLLQGLKTGALIRFACDAGALIADLEPPVRAAVGRFGDRLGLAFQIRDDLLDVTGDETAVGKDLGRDAARGKATFVAAMGVDGANKALRDLEAEAFAELDSLGPDAFLMREVFTFVAARDS